VKRKVLASLLVIAVVAGLVGAGTFAYFSDTEESSANTFTAGTLELTVTGSEGATAGWVTPSNWAPGDTEVGNVVLANVGTINASELLMDVAVTAGAPDISDMVIITAMTYPTGATSILGDIQSALTDSGDLRLNELDVLTNYDLGALAAATSGTLEMTFEFDSAAGDTYQGASAAMVITFDLNQ